MKIMLMYSAKPGAFVEAVRRFKAGLAIPGEGVTQLGRWHATDFSVGFALYETDSPAALYASASRWADILDVKHHLVIEDGEVAPILARISVP
jgi:hypothetical protein